MENEEEYEDADDDFSAIAWEVATRGKGGREIAQLHESWSAALQARGTFNKAQEHLDQAIEAWIHYDEPFLRARAWCLKAGCSSEAGDFTSAATSFKTAQKIAVEVEDAPLELCILTNLAICDIHLGHCKAAATRSRRAFVKAEVEGDPEMLLKTLCVRASSYLMVGNFLAACNEYEAARRLIEEGQVLPPEPHFAIALDTNFGISALRSGKPDQASVAFERALEAVRGGETSGTDPSPLTLARCLFHTGEARRQNGELFVANTLLKEAAAIVTAESSAELGNYAAQRSKWAALAIEVANSLGLCALAEGAQRFCGERAPLRSTDSTVKSIDAPDESATARTKSSEASSVQTEGIEDAAGAAALHRGSVESLRRGSDGSWKQWRRSNSSSSSGSGSSGSAEAEQGVEIAAEKAARLIAAGCKAAEAGAHPIQRTNGAVLEGLAWSLAGRGSTEGVAAMTRAERMLEKILTAEKRQSGRLPSSSKPSEAVGACVPAGSESSDQLQTLQVGVISGQGLALRGGIGLGAGFCTSSAAKGLVPKGAGTPAGAARALATMANTRNAARTANAAMVEAGSFAKRQLEVAAKDTVVSPREISLGNAHAGAIALMLGKPREAEGHFKRQLQEATKTGDLILEALAERNLADTKEVDKDVLGTLAHLRRCRALAQRGRNTALEADACRRLSSVYAEIAGIAAALGSSSGDTQGGGGISGGGGDDGVSGNGQHSQEEGAVQSLSDGETGSPEAGGGGDSNGVSDSVAMPEEEIEEMEDKDFEFLKATAGDRSRLFAERYEAAVHRLEWPVSVLVPNVGNGPSATKRKSSIAITTRRGSSSGGGAHVVKKDDQAASVAQVAVVE